MRVVQLAFASVAAALALPVGAAMASTCTAPGHPSCTITCPGGCGALYVEPNGPCRTMCSGQQAKAEGGKSAVGSSGLSGKELMDLMSGKAGKTMPMSTPPKK